MSPKWAFGVAMLVAVHCTSTWRMLGALCFQNGQFGCISFTLSLFVSTASQNLGRQCFRQAHVAHFCAFAKRTASRCNLCTSPPAPPNPTAVPSHVWGFPTCRLGNRSHHSTVCWPGAPSSAREGRSCSIVHSCSPFVILNQSRYPIGSVG